MPTASQHKTKAERNRQFLDGIQIDGYPEWAAVVAFYTAIHVVERVRAASGHGDSTGHEDRLGYVQHEHPRIHGPYHLLQNVSMLARYQSNADFFKQFQPEDVKEKLIDGCLTQVADYASERLGS
jgi:hypothetical protein